MTIKVALTHGRVALVDDQDADLGDVKWHALLDGRGPNSRCYAVRNPPRNGKPRTILKMHRVILGRKIGRMLTENEQVDHINHDGLDNRRSNLRLVTSSQNHMNERTRSSAKSSKYKGVCWHKTKHKWDAAIRCNGIRKNIGRFNSEEDAALAYDRAAKEVFGDFADTNFK